MRRIKSLESSRDFQSIMPLPKGPTECAMIDKAKSIEAFIELIDCINEGTLNELSVEFILRNGKKVSWPVPVSIHNGRPTLKIIEGEKNSEG